MRTAEPIKEDEWIIKFAEELKSRNERDYIMFMMGIFAGLKIADTLPLKVVDVTGSHVVFGKKKSNVVVIHPTLRKAIDNYVIGMKKNDFLVLSRNKTEAGKQKPISGRQALHILQSAAKRIGYEGKIGTHSLRKTFGYRYYEQYEDVGELQILLNHSSPSETLQYIGVSEC